MGKKTRDLKAILAAAAVAMVGLSVLSPAPSQSQTLTDEQARQRIDEGVFTPYTREAFPKTFAILGELVVLGPVQELRERAALTVIKRGYCDRVEISELSPNRSTREHWEVFVDCADGTRYRMDYEGDLSRG